MRLLAKCPACGGQIELTLKDLDRRKYCGHCRRMFKVPDAEQMKKALDVAKNSGGAVYVDERGRIYG